jgi:hypothetical protein
MKIDDKVLEVCARAVNETANKQFNLYRVGKEESFVLAETCITAYLKETQGQTEVEPSCDVVERVARAIHNCINRLQPDIQYFEGASYNCCAKAAIAALQQKPKDAKPNNEALIGEIQECLNYLNASQGGWTSDEGVYAMSILTKCLTELKR